MLGLGAANLINLLGSDVVILGGYFAEIAQWILPARRAAGTGPCYHASRRPYCDIDSRLQRSRPRRSPASCQSGSVGSHPPTPHLIGQGRTEELRHPHRRNARRRPCGCPASDQNARYDDCRWPGSRVLKPPIPRGVGVARPIDDPRHNARPVITGQNRRTF
jgi:hypothetical protein